MAIETAEEEYFFDSRRFATAFCGEPFDREYAEASRQKAIIMHTPAQTRA
jgi:hypothetical protein